MDFTGNGGCATSRRIERPEPEWATHGPASGSGEGGDSARATRPPGAGNRPERQEARRTRGRPARKNWPAQSAGSTGRPVYPAGRIRPRQENTTRTGQVFKAMLPHGTSINKYLLNGTSATRSRKPLQNQVFAFILSARYKVNPTKWR